MKKPWESDSCEQVQSYYTNYPVPVAAALWCGIPSAEVQEHLKIAVEVGRAIFRHPYIPCLEPRCRAIHEAIDKGALLVSRESGQAFDGRTDHVAPPRRHVSRHNLKEWIAKEFPSDKPSFLFDEVERGTHSAINAESFRALQADRDALSTRLEDAKKWAQKIIAEKNELLGECESLRAMVDGQRAPSQRTETTYLNIIGVMLELIQSPRPGRNSNASIIDEMISNYGEKPGISKSTLENKFAEAKRSLEN